MLTHSALTVGVTHWHSAAHWEPCGKVCGCRGRSSCAPRRSRWPERASGWCYPALCSECQASLRKQTTRGLVWTTHTNVTIWHGKRRCFYVNVSKCKVFSYFRFTKVMLCLPSAVNWISLTINWTKQDLWTGCGKRGSAFIFIAQTRK